MPPTIADIQSSIVSGLKGKLAFVGLSVLADGTNPDLMAPISNALSVLACPPSDFANPVDRDIAALPPARIPALLGLARLFALQAIWGSMTDVSETELDRQQEWSSMSAEILQAIAALEARYKTLLQAYAPIRSGTTRIPTVRRGWRCEL